MVKSNVTEGSKKQSLVRKKPFKQQKSDNKKKISDVSVEHIIQCLQGLHGLNWADARVYIEVLSRKSVTVRDLHQIFNNLNLDISKSKANDIMKIYESKRLVFPIQSSKPAKKYKAIHPRELQLQLKKIFPVFEKEVAYLEQSYESVKYEESLDPRNISRILSCESEIRTVLFEMKNKYQITILSSNDKETKEFMESLDGFSKTVSGSLDAILFRSDEQSGVLYVCKRTNEDGTLRLFGVLIFCSKQYDFLYDNEVNKNG